MKKINLLKNLYEKWSGESVKTISKLPISGSNREYYRLIGCDKKAIGVINNEFNENKAFIEFSKHFKSKELNVPKIYSVDLDNSIYLQEDLGDITLFSFLIKINSGNSFTKEAIDIYKKVLKELPKFQIIGNEGLNYNLCFPRSKFDMQSMQWDLNYFKYYFLKLADIPFNEQLLENDFNKLIDYLQKVKSDYFLYRDFQSRNIMIKEDDLYFIDYQGGRRGALQYDVASLLYDAKANIPQDIREELLDFYIDNLQQYESVDIEKFKEDYYAFVLIRIMQAMGAYGFRGFYEKKAHFLQSIPYALKNLDWIIKNTNIPLSIPHLMGVFDKIILSKKLKRFKSNIDNKSNLSVFITSFSYKKGIPKDGSGNGGGFVFDCRAIHNPGRYDKYKKLTGKDRPVIDFFEKETEIHEFLHNVFSIVDMSVETYIERGFTNLVVNFGCTGGQHRSVYSAEQLFKHLQNKYNIQLSIWHREQD